MRQPLSTAIAFIPQFDALPATSTFLIGSSWKPDHCQNQKYVSSTETSGCVTDGRKKYLYGGCGQGRRHCPLLLVVGLAVATRGPCRHGPGKVSISPDGSFLQPTAVAISYSFGSQDFSYTAPPPGSVLGFPRRLAAKDSAEWWELAFKEVGQQTGSRCWGGRTGGGSWGFEIIFLGVSSRTAPLGTSQWGA